MITVSISRLLEAINEAHEFKLPAMNAGTEYLYDRLYRRLSRGESVRVSELDFNAFEDEDISSLNSLHTDTFERNERMADGITSELNRIAPIYKPVCYV